MKTKDRTLYLKRAREAKTMRYYSFSYFMPMVGGSFYYRKKESSV